MKRPGFMILETVIAMSVLALISFAAIKVISSNRSHIEALTNKYELLLTAKKHLTLRLLNPAQKEHDEALFERSNVIIKAKVTDIEPKSSLKNHMHDLKILNVTVHKEGFQQDAVNVIGFIMASQPEAQK
jgi:hypothetical protein